MSPKSSSSPLSEFFYSIFTDSGTPVRLYWQVVQGILIVVSCISMIFEVYEPYRVGYADFISTLELIAVGFLTVDYAGALYYAEDRMRYTFSFWGLVDMLSILPFYLLIFNPTSAVLVKSLRGLRFLRLLVIWRLARGR